MRSSRAAVLGSLLFTLVVPGTVVGLVPWFLAERFPRPPLPGGLRWAGVVLLVPGAVVLLDSIARFARELGTPAPSAPTEGLVVTGLYRHVRNPMYLAVVAILIGEALLFRRGVLLAYAGAVWVAVHLFVLGYEEPTLERRYGADYEAYRRMVRRWLPKIRPAEPARARASGR